MKKNTLKILATYQHANLFLYIYPISIQYNKNMIYDRCLYMKYTRENLVRKYNFGGINKCNSLPSSSNIVVANAGGCGSISLEAKL